MTINFWMIIGMGIVLISFLGYRYFSSRETMKLMKEEEERLKKLIRDGVRITIDLSKCEIRSSSYHVKQKEVNYLDELEAIDIILDSGKGEKPQTVTQTVLIYTHHLDSGREIKFYGPTSKDKRTLEMLCMMQNSTSIYFDLDDPEVYYFDLTFLD